MKALLQLAKIFNATSSFNKFWNTKVLSKWTKINGVYSRHNLPKIKDCAYVINLDEHVNNNITYFDSFGVEHISREIKTFIGNKNIITLIKTFIGNKNIILRN